MDSSSRPIHEPFRGLLEQIRDLTIKMKSEAAKLGIEKEFSMDGRLLGDLGQIIAQKHFEVELTKTQKKGYNALCLKTERQIQIKLRSKAGGIEIDSDKVPPLFLVLYLCPETLTWRTVFNGPGTDIPEGRIKAGIRHINLGELEDSYKKVKSGSGVIERNLGSPSEKENL